MFRDLVSLENNYFRRLSSAWRGKGRQVLGTSLQGTKESYCWYILGSLCKVLFHRKNLLIMIARRNRILWMMFP